MPMPHESSGVGSHNTQTRRGATLSRVAILVPVVLAVVLIGGLWSPVASTNGGTPAVRDLQKPASLSRAPLSPSAIVALAVEHSATLSAPPVPSGPPATTTQAPPPPPIPLRDVGGAISNCPDEDIYLALWLLSGKHADFSARPLTIVDIGSNKGYSIAALIEAMQLTTPPPSTDIREWNYDPDYAAAATEEARAAVNASREANRVQTGYLSKSALALTLYRHFHQNKLKVSEVGGACAESTAPHLFDPSLFTAAHPWATRAKAEGRKAFIPKVEVIAVDGVKDHARMCDLFFRPQSEHYVAYSKARGLPYTEFNFTCHHAAASSKEGTVMFPNLAFGEETGRMVGSGNADDKALIAVPMHTLATLVPPHIDTIDVLLTDTEGNDFDVFEGARDRFFRDGKVGIYVFETHVGPNKRPLLSIISELEAYGYDCFFPLHPPRVLVYPITPVSTRYDSSFDSQGRGWKNVVCFQMTRFPGLKEVAQELARTQRPSLQKKPWHVLYPWHAASLSS